ncbi:MAG: GAF domain-containing protein [Candidatus Omnitrophica bacterium]|nr:GAF domain-containing protein [Candidatus Omnitrophota bacterium]
MDLQLIIAALIAGIINIILGSFVYFKNPKRPTNIFFGLMTFSIALWNFSDFAAFIKNPSIALFWLRGFYIPGIFIGVFSVHFVISIVRDIVYKNWKRAFVIIYSGAIVLFVLTTTRFIIKEVALRPFKEIPGPLYFLFIIFFAACFLYGFYILVIGFRKAVGLKKLQISYLFLSYIIGLVAALIYFLGLNLWANLPPIHYIIEISYVFVVTYAIIRYRVMDIKVVISRAGIFAIVYTLVLGIPFGIGSLVRDPLYKIAPDWWWLLPMFLLVVLATLAPYIYMRLQKRIELRLRAEEFRSHEALRRLSHNMLRFPNLNNLLKLIVHQLVKILKLKFAVIYLFDTKDEKYIMKTYWRPEQFLKTAFEPPAEFSKDSSLVKDFYLRRLPIVTEELKLFMPKGTSIHIRELVNSLARLKANTVIPSFLRNRILGFLVLSDRRTNAAFTQEDLNLLMVLSNEAALAIENAQFHEKEKSVLAERSRREALADMAPGASHQFNNRLVAISSSAELALFRLENINIDKIEQEDVKTAIKDIKSRLELIDKEVYKGKEITSAILKRAKAKVDFQDVELRTLIENAYRLVKISYSKSGLEKSESLGFNITVSNEVPLIFGSEALLQDCFYNLIDNAFDAIRERMGDNITDGKIEVVLTKEGQDVIVQVKDNGIGLTKENQRKLFAPYFTTKASSNKGSGLGLYVIQDFIEMHQGTIRCDSEYQKGTSFTIRLPIRKRGR